MTSSLAILGSGSWGTALGLHLARQGLRVHLWSIVPEEIAVMLKNKENTYFLPGFPLPDNILPTTDLSTAVREVDYIIIAVPSKGFRSTLQSLKPLLSSHTKGIICASKGLDAESGQLLHDVSKEILGENQPFAALSGPSFAKEVAKALPAALVVASPHQSLQQSFIAIAESDLFQLSASDDIIGVEIGGIVKNVIALATGMIDGMQFGSNARCALITHGLNEMITLGMAMGGKIDTFIGLSGVGDLILTATDNQSRNRRLGLALGEGKTIQLAEQEIGQAVEGKENARLIVALAKKHGIRLPLCERVWEIVQGNISLKDIGYEFLSGKN